MPVNARLRRGAETRTLPCTASDDVRSCGSAIEWLSRAHRRPDRDAHPSGCGHAGGRSLLRAASFAVRSMSPVGAPLRAVRGEHLARSGSGRDFGSRQNGAGRSRHRHGRRAATTFVAEGLPVTSVADPPSRHPEFSRPIRAATTYGPATHPQLPVASPTALVGQDHAVRMRLGVTLWALSWVPYGLILGLAGAWLTVGVGLRVRTRPRRDRHRGRRVHRAVKGQGWRRASAVAWEALRHGDTVQA